VSNPLRTSEDYELFLYTLGGQFPSVRRSTVTFIRRWAALARVAGELGFDHDDPALQSTHPHHKHIPPDIKHHRIPAPEMSFNQPNLPVLIHEIEVLIERLETDLKNESPRD
jgi:hypothetical protein